MKRRKNCLKACHSTSKYPRFLVAELAPLMAERGKGAIVNVSTMVADYGVSGMSLYGSSKAAVNLLTVMGG